MFKQALLAKTSRCLLAHYFKNIHSEYCRHQIWCDEPWLLTRAHHDLAQFKHNKRWLNLLRRCWDFILPVIKVLIFPWMLSSVEQITIDGQEKQTSKQANFPKLLDCSKNLKNIVAWTHKNKDQISSPLQNPKEFAYLLLFYSFHWNFQTQAKV